MLYRWKYSDIQIETMSNCIFHEQCRGEEILLGRIQADRRSVSLVEGSRKMIILFFPSMSRPMGTNEGQALLDNCGWWLCHIRRFAGVGFRRLRCRCDCAILESAESAVSHSLSNDTTHIAYRRKRERDMSERTKRLFRQRSPVASIRSLD